FRMHRYGKLLETPLGVAAGPHTQLSQNLISAWLTGARYLELKTVQVLDELAVTKPCIDMTDEGYNCEWSQELKLDQSFNEYLNAWIVLHILKDKFGWGPPKEPGFICNMSVGYNLEGIQSSGVQRFLDRMADCSQEKAEIIERLAGFYPRLKDLIIPDTISDNITISTMHGCPPDEVEKIGRYFIEERRLNTSIKLNPTLLGPERVRDILNNKLGFETQVPDLAFEHDLKYPDGVDLIRSLLVSAAKTGVALNIKLTNTLETSNRDQNLPKNEQMVYMSGRALHPISINLAARLQEAFDGALDISFCAGTDCFNFADVIACNLKPVTVCSDILKPGGYGRLSQYLEELRNTMQERGTLTIEEFIAARSRETGDPTQAGLMNLKIYAARVVKKENYKKIRFPYDNIKTPRELHTFDCIEAPCMTTCPVSQDIPGYMYYTAQGDFAQAHQVILETNPFPNIQGMVCDHLCQTKCTRINYDDPLLIREIKRFVAQRHAGGAGLKPAPSNGKKVAIIGAGPSGLACAYFLALKGFEVYIYESKAFAGGWASDAIPAFRLDEASIRKDIDAILSLGVSIHYQTKVDRTLFEQLRNEVDYIYIAIGAQVGTELEVPGEDAEGVLDQLQFLSAVRRGERPDLGKKVAVIGGGNSAMDAARTAKRLVGEAGEVSVVYRRTRQEMPAAPEEVQALQDEGIQLIELTAPECMLVEDGRVVSNVCFRMKLGETDTSGRPRPIRIDGSEFNLDVDSVISAIGQRVTLDFFPDKKLEINPATRETQFENIFAGGDAVRGPSTLIKAIGDGKKVAESITRRALKGLKIPTSISTKPSDSARMLERRARRRYGAKLPEIDSTERSGFDLVIRTLDEGAAQREADRCLQCDERCSVCVTVCPNRANMEFTLAPVKFKIQQCRRTTEGIEMTDLETANIEQKYQILNIGDFCNECGNCATFCPTSGAPYKDKAKFHLSRESYDASRFGYHFSSHDELLCKKGDQNANLKRNANGLIFENHEVKVKIDPASYRAEVVHLKTDTSNWVALHPAVEMCILFQALYPQSIFFKR
ncbi:MAG: putative selenate reductase subunit YgfK, partial [Desulfobacterales bacterium]|nr:putative selenate reductase subunit YgfK [Desulfobacterales bacterium]